MSRKRFTVPRGSKLVVSLSVSKPSISEVSEQEQKKSGVIKIDEEDDLYVFSDTNTIRFYDLGTRLRSVPSSAVFDGRRIRAWPNLIDDTVPADSKTSEYVEIALEVPATFILGQVGNTVYETAQITDSNWSTLNNILLGSLKPLAIGESPSDMVNPIAFSVANGSNRRIPNCAEIPASQAANCSTILTISPFLTEINPLQIHSANFTYRQNNDFLIGSSANNIATERWNPRNVTEGTTARKSDLLKARKGLFKTVSGPIRIVTNTRSSSAMRVPYHHGFDTSDEVKYKITSEPLYTASRVAYSFQGKDTRIYLRPRENGMSLVASGRIGTWVGRAVPFYPLRPNQASWSEPFVPNAYRCVIDRSAYSNMQLFVEGSYLSTIRVNIEVGGNFRGLALRQGSLAAIIVEGSKSFFIWANQDIRDFIGLVDESAGVDRSGTTVIVGTCT